MSKKDKLILRLKSRPKNFTYQELRKILSFLGYKESNKGKTSGSRVAFINDETKHIIRLHKPHPDNELKQYQIDLILEELASRGVL